MSPVLKRGGKRSSYSPSSAAPCQAPLGDAVPSNPYPNPSRRAPRLDGRRTMRRLALRENSTAKGSKLGEVDPVFQGWGFRQTKSGRRRHPLQSVEPEARAQLVAWLRNAIRKAARVPHEFNAEIQARHVTAADSDYDVVPHSLEEMEIRAELEEPRSSSLTSR